MDIKKDEIIKIKDLSKMIVKGTTELNNYLSNLFEDVFKVSDIMNRIPISYTNADIEIYKTHTEDQFKSLTLLSNRDYVTKLTTDIDKDTILYINNKNIKCGVINDKYRIDKKGPHEEYNHKFTELPKRVEPNTLIVVIENETMEMSKAKGIGSMSKSLRVVIY